MPYQEQALSAELRSACARSIHLVHPDGRMERGGLAVLSILQALGWWWVLPFRWPPMIWVVELMYRVVARNRLFFSRFLFTNRDAGG